MDRREFLKKSGMAAVGSLLLATPLAATKRITPQRYFSSETAGQP
jgi:hypothetical protein